MIEMHWVIFVFALLVCGVIGWLVCRRIERGYRRAVEAENRVLREDHGRSGVSGEISKGDSAGARLERAYCEYVGKETAEWTEPGLKKPFTGGRDERN